MNRVNISPDLVHSLITREEAENYNVTALYKMLLQQVKFSCFISYRKTTIVYTTMGQWWPILSFNLRQPVLSHSLLFNDNSEISCKSTEYFGVHMT